MIGTNPGSPVDAILFVALAVIIISVTTHTIYKKIKWKLNLREKKKSQRDIIVQASYPKDD